MKVSLLLCVCMALTGTQIAGCGAPVEPSESDVAVTNGAQENVPLSASASANPESNETATPVDCPDLTPEQIKCGQIGISLKGHGSSCQLAPTANDLTRPPRSVRFDCHELEHGPNGYDYDALGHITLMGSTCDALQEGGGHRVTLLLSCPP